MFKPTYTEKKKKKIERWKKVDNPDWDYNWNRPKNKKTDNSGEKKRWTDNILGFFKFTQPEEKPRRFIKIPALQKKVPEANK